MTREIKFRAWDKETGKMVAGIEVADFVSPELQQQLNKSVLVFMQYTGLKDKNGVEIYEGDIVRYEPMKNQAGLHQIVYVPNAGAYLLQAITRASINPIGMKYLGDIVHDASDTRTYHRCEVIGNIYENPELLKGEDNEHTR